MADHTSLKGFDNIGDSLLSDQLESNICAFFQWGLLGKGAFWNVTIPSSGLYGGHFHRLRPVADPSYTNGQVWEGFRGDWVWETGVEYSRQPIRVSGVFVNGSFQPVTGVGTYAHTIDYKHGQIIFDSPISTGAAVTCEFSYRTHAFSQASVGWWKQFQIDTYRVDQSTFLQAGSGAWGVLAENRVALPHVIVQAVPNARRYGAEVGNLRHVVRQDVLFHIISETPYDLGKLHDAITYQQDKRIVAFEKNDVLKDQRYGLDIDGSPAQSGLMYPELVQEYEWKRVSFVDAIGTPQPFQATVPLYMATVRGTFEIDLP